MALVLVLVDQRLAIKHLQDHAALVFGHALDVERELRVDEDRLIAGDGVDRHDRMRHRGIDVLEAASQAIPSRSLGNRLRKGLKRPLVVVDDEFKLRVTHTHFDWVAGVQTGSMMPGHWKARAASRHGRSHCETSRRGWPQGPRTRDAGDPASTMELGEPIAARV